MTGKIITFYSYKGGTGRSMALANVAYILSSKPADNLTQSNAEFADAPLYKNKRVLMIDWDLEAPGLYRYFEHDFTPKSRYPLHRKSPNQLLQETGGLLEFLELAATTYREEYPQGMLPESQAHTAESLAIYQEVCRKINFNDDLLLQVGDNQNLRLLKAGFENDTYPNRVRTFDWESFYEQYGSFFTHFRQHLANDFDYILIDSRTGLTDTSGICTRVMPEKLVAVFAPNVQNIEGVKKVVHRAIEHRRDSRDPRGLTVFPLASRIDSQASRLRKIWWKGGELSGDEITGYEKIFEDLFIDMFELDVCKLADYFDATQIPHDSDYAYGEEIAVRIDSGASDKLSIGTACANLTQRLVLLDAPWESLPEHTQLSEAKHEAERAKLTVEEWEKKIRRNRRIAAVGTVLMVLAAFTIAFFAWRSARKEKAKAEARAAAEKANTAGLVDVKDGKKEPAVAKFTQAIQSDPDYADAYLNRARGYSSLRLDQTALLDYDHAIQLNPTAAAYTERGDIYRDQDDFDKAIADYTSALALKPDDWKTLTSRAQTFHQKKSFDWAISDYTQIINSAPEEFKQSAYVGRARAYQEIHDTNKQIADLLKAMESPSDSDARYMASFDLRNAGYVNPEPVGQVPTVFKVYILYSDDKDSSIVDEVVTKLRSDRLSVTKSKIVDVAFNSGSDDVFYYSTSPEAKAMATTIKQNVEKVVTSILTSTRLSLRVTELSNYFPYVPRGNIEVYLGPLSSAGLQPSAKQSNTNQSDLRSQPRAAAAPR